MTLIIGAKYKEGIILGADQKVMRGMETSYTPKLHMIAGGVVGVAGPTGIRDDFLHLAEERIPSARPRSLYEVKIEIEDIVGMLSNRYGERAPELAGINALLGGLEFLDRGKAKLYHILNVGYAEEIDFLCIGHGSPYATALGKFLYDENYSFDEMSRLIVFLINWVSDELDVTVGGTPDVAFISNDSVKIRYLETKLVEGLEGNFRKVERKIHEVLKLPYDVPNED